MSKRKPTKRQIEDTIVCLCEWLSECAYAAEVYAVHSGAAQLQEIAQKLGILRDSCKGIEPDLARTYTEWVHAGGLDKLPCGGLDVQVTAVWPLMRESKDASDYITRLMTTVWEGDNAHALN